MSTIFKKILTKIRYSGQSPKPDEHTTKVEIKNETKRDPDPALFKFIHDVQGMTDVLYKYIHVQLFDQVGIQDLPDILLRVNGTYMNEALGTVDSINFYAKSAIANNAAIQDLLSLNVGKAFSDSFSIVESYIFTVNKGNLENVSITESIAFQVEFYRTITDPTGISDIISLRPLKSFSESCGISDSILLKPNKGILEGPSLQDSLSFAFYKSISESLNIADTFSAGLSSDGSKEIPETAGLLDILAFDVTKPLDPEAFSVIDIVAMKPGKPFSELVSISETILLKPGLGPIDVLSFIETFNFDIGQGIVETPAFVEFLEMAVAISKADPVNISENISLKPTTVHSEAIGIIETIAKNISILVTEVVNLQDTFSPFLYSGLALNYPETSTLADVISFYAKRVTTEISSIVEFVAFTVGHPVVESAVITEVVAKTVKLVLSDVINVVDDFASQLDVGGSEYTANPTDTSGLSDSLTIYQQDYFASDYVEPGYVGTIYNI